jgi:hypothetical protein
VVLPVKGTDGGSHSPLISTLSQDERKEKKDTGKDTKVDYSKIRFDKFSNKEKDVRGRSHSEGDHQKRRGSMVDMYILPSLQPSKYIHHRPSGEGMSSFSIAFSGASTGAAIKDKHTSLGSSSSSNPTSSVKSINKDRKVKSVRMAAEVLSLPLDTAPIRRALLVNAKLSLRKVDVVEKKKDDREVMLNSIKGFKAKLRPTSDRISKEAVGVLGAPRKTIVSSDSDLLGMIKNTMTARRDKMIGNTTGEIVTGFSTSNAKMNDVSETYTSLCG